jgi:hypothetical protein
MAIKKLSFKEDFSVVVGLVGKDVSVGGVMGFKGENAQANAEQDATDRNAKAKDMGIKARYEVVIN